MNFFELQTVLSEQKLFGVPLIYIFIAVSAVLPRLPIIGKFFNNVNTALHEFGHAFVALLLGGKIHRITLNKDASGTTATKDIGNRAGAFLVAVSGYVLSSSFAWLAFYLINAGADNVLVIGLTLLFFVMLLFWIRNAYGVIWVLLFCLLNTSVVLLDNMLVVKTISLFYATEILTDSVFSTLIQLKIVLQQQNSSCDAQILAKLTHVPAIVWAFLFVSYSIWIAYAVFTSFVL